MVVKDEAQHLSRCLNSVRELAPELIVVDTGSTDESSRIAIEHGAEVVPFDFNRVDFSAARNRSLECANCPWILVLDADEMLHPDSLPQVRDIAQGTGGAGYFFERSNHASDSTTCTIDHVVRLFSNLPEYRYRGRVHETIDDSILAAGGRLVTSSIRIEHQFASNRETRRRKNHWYVEILKEEIMADPGDLSRRDFLAAEYHQLEMYAEATEIAEQLASLRPSDPRAHLFAGTYHFLFQPDWAKARAEFQRALKLQPGYPEAEYFLRRLEEELAQRQQA